MKKILIAEGCTYSLFMFFLVEKNIDNVIFLLNEGIPKSIRENIKKIYGKDKVYVQEKLSLKKDISLKNKLRALKVLFNFFKFILKLDKREIEKFYIKPGLIISYPFVFKEKIILEEGKNKPFYLEDKYLYKILNNPKYIKNIYLLENSEKIEAFESKINLVNLKNLWTEKNDDEKLKILNIFNFSQEIICKLKSKKTILLTQPLDDYGISEKEKIAIYADIIKKIKKDNLIIKVHPRERTNYKKYFPDITVIDRNTVSEIFYLLNIKFENIITLFSAAALNLEGERLCFLGTNNNNLLEKIFGKIEGYEEFNNLNN